MPFDASVGSSCKGFMYPLAFLIVNPFPGRPVAHSYLKELTPAIIVYPFSNRALKNPSHVIARSSFCDEAISNPLILLKERLPRCARNDYLKARASVITISPGETLTAPVAVKGGTLMHMIAFDSHKRYTVASVQSMEGRILREARIEHGRGNIAGFLAQWDKGSPVAVETIGNWYWIIEEIEHAEMRPCLVHARKAKLMLGMINKTDKLDARGLNRLQQTGTLPTVWIPPLEIRDKRELPRTRMILAHQRTKLKNRIHSVIDKYGLQNKFTDISDMFGREGRKVIQKSLVVLPEQTRYALEILLNHLDEVSRQVGEIEKRMEEVFQPNEEIKLLMTMPGVGFILAVVMSLEIGDIGRFSGPERLASYSGTVPRVHASGGKVRYGRLRPDTNRYLKWAFSEGGNSVAVNRNKWPLRHVSKIYGRVRHRQGHAKAVGAVARHLAEATYWILTKKEAYKERGISRVSKMEA
jgi:transposase